MAVALQVAILLAAIAPFVRLAVCRPFLRRLGSVPELAVIGFAALAGYVIGVILIAVAAPALLLPLVVVAVALWLYAAWRARPSFGADGQLPPGSLRLAPVGLWNDPQYFARDRDRFGPIFKSTTLLATPTVCIASLPAAFDLFDKHDTVLETPPNRFDRHIPGGFLRSMDDAKHAKFGPPLRSALSPTVIREAEPELRDMCLAYLHEKANQAAVPVGSMTRELTTRMFLRLFFGVAPNDPEAPELERLFRNIDPRSAWRTRKSTTEAALAEIAAIIDQHGRPSFTSVLRSAHGEFLEDPTIVRNLVYMCQTGTADSSGLFAWAIWNLTVTRGAVEHLRASSDPKWTRRVLQETLRMEQSEYLTRTVTASIAWHGYKIPRGWRVRVCVRESHRDPNVFDHADEFDPDRFIEPIPHTKFSAFGAPTTRATCPGEGLTMATGRIILEELVAGYDWTAVTTPKPDFSGFHWRPSPKFAVALTRRRNA